MSQFVLWHVKAVTTEGADIVASKYQVMPVLWYRGVLKGISDAASASQAEAARCHPRYHHSFRVEVIISSGMAQQLPSGADSQHVRPALLKPA